MQRAGVVRKVDSQSNQAAIFDQAALDDPGEQGHVNIAPADQYGNLLSGHLYLVIDYGGDGRGARAFRHGLFALQQEQNGVGNFFFVHGDDLVHILLNQG